MFLVVRGTVLARGGAVSTETVNPDTKSFVVAAGDERTAPGLGHRDPRPTGSPAAVFSRVLQPE